MKNKYRVFSTKGMVHIPQRKEFFRVGRDVGVCILKIKNLVIMKKC